MERLCSNKRYSWLTVQRLSQLPQCADVGLNACKGGLI